MVENQTYVDCVNGVLKYGFEMNPNQSLMVMLMRVFGWG